MPRLWPRACRRPPRGLWVGAALAAANFPPLTGRVVDQANILSPVTKPTSKRKLADLEQKSRIQLVVATVPSLDGEEIEPYANGLFRAWKLGEAKEEQRRAPPDRAKGAAGAHRGRLWPRRHADRRCLEHHHCRMRSRRDFKAGDFNGGVTRGVDDIITALTTDSAEWKPKPTDMRPEHEAFRSLDTLAPFLIFLFIMFVISRSAGEAEAATSFSFRWAPEVLAGAGGRRRFWRRRGICGGGFLAAAGLPAAAAPRGAGDDPRRGCGGACRDRLRRRAAQDPQRRSCACSPAPPRPGRRVSARRLRHRPRDAAAAARCSPSFPRTVSMSFSCSSRFSPRCWSHCRRCGGGSFRSAWRARLAIGRRSRSSSCAGSTARDAARSSMCRWPSITSASFRQKMRPRHLPRTMAGRRQRGARTACGRGDGSRADRARRALWRNSRCTLSRPARPWTRRSNGSTSFDFRGRSNVYESGRLLAT